MKLPTKLGFLVATGVAGVLAIGVPGAVDRFDRAQTVSDHRAQVQTLESLVRFHELADREATLSAWYVASGQTAAGRTLRTVRPDADRAARALDEDGRAAGDRLAPAVRRLQQEWETIRKGRASIDRRVVGDDAALTRFDRVSESIRRALDIGAGADGTPAASGIHSLVAIDGLRTAVGREQAAVAVAIARAAVSPSVLARVRAADSQQTAVRNPALTSARDTVGTGIDDDLGALRATTALVRTTRAPVLLGVAPFVAPAQWQERSDGQIRALNAIARSVESTVDTRIATKQRDADGDIVRWLSLLAAVVVAVAGIGLIIGHAVRRPLRTVRQAAVDLADRERVAVASPAPGPTEAPITEPAARGDDEVGDIARAVQSIDRSVVEARGLQDASRQRDLSDLSVKIVQRNQPLLSRQLALIEALQGSEGPDRSAMLAQLDHLAIRMRRNSESLLVLAGLEPIRSHPEPVALIDVVTAALGEIDDADRVDVLGVPTDIAVLGWIVVDLVHMLAELVENATTYSPPATRVFVGTLQRPGAIEVTISDAGEGLPVDRLDALNEQLRHPPRSGCDPSRSLGLVVVARLCERLGVRVSLRSTLGVGTAAVLTLPIALIVGSVGSDAVPSIALDPETIHRPSRPLDLTLGEPTRYAPVTTRAADDRRPSPAVAAPPLPRRHRDQVLAPVSELQRPEARPPTAVFELVARFEAGRRRAGRVETADDSDDG